MANLNTKIEWTDATWNPSSGCTKVSTGCKHCYAERLFPRVYGQDKKKYTDEFGIRILRPRKFTDVKLHPDRLDQPLHWKKPRMIFVNSMSDLFHEDIPFEFIDKIFAIMMSTPNHTYQILTKRPKRMLEYLEQANIEDRINSAVPQVCHDFTSVWEWPIENIWQGISCENQATANERIPILLQVPATVRFLSCEPLLDRVQLDGRAFWLNCCGCTEPENDIATNDCPKCNGTAAVSGIDWVIVGGESGPGYRPMNLDWARSIRDQCQDAGVPFFFKQTADKKEIPLDLQIREYPECHTVLSE